MDCRGFRTRAGYSASIVVRPFAVKLLSIRSCFPIFRFLSYAALRAPDMRDSRNSCRTTALLCSRSCELKINVIVP